MRHRCCLVTCLATLLVCHGAVLVHGQTFQATFQIDPDTSGGCTGSVWGVDCFHIGGIVEAEVSDDEVQVLPIAIQILPLGPDVFSHVFSQPAVVDEELDTDNNGEPDTWRFTMDDTDCTDDGALNSYTGTLSSLPLQSAHLEISGFSSECEGDFDVNFDLVADEMPAGAATRIPTLSILGILAFIVSLAAVGMRLSMH